MPTIIWGPILFENVVNFLVNCKSPLAVVSVGGAEGWSYRRTTISPGEISELNLELIPQIIDQMKVETNVKVLKKYLEYLRANPVIRAVPIYFQIIDSQTFITKKYNLPVNLCDVIIPVIEGAYNHQYKSDNNKKPFATEKWRNLWKTDGKNYEKWVDLLFEQNIYVGLFVKHYSKTLHKAYLAIKHR